VGVGGFHHVPEDTLLDAGDVFDAPVGDGEFGDEHVFVSAGRAELSAVAGEERFEFMVGLGEEGGGSSQHGVTGCIAAGTGLSLV
jgi:hypothetical protein